MAGKRYRSNSYFNPRNIAAAVGTAYNLGNQGYNLYKRARTAYDKGRGIPNYVGRAVSSGVATANKSVSRTVTATANRRNGKRGRVVRGYVRKLARMKKKRASKFNKSHGVVTKFEFGSEIADPECVYIGHGISTVTFADHIVRNLVKILFKKAGIDIPAWEDPIAFSSADKWYVQIRYWSSPQAASALSADAGDFSSGSTWKDLADAVLTAITAVSTLNTRWDSMFLFDGGKADTNRIMLASMNLQSVMFNFRFVSKLKVQNVTEAGTGADDNDELATNVEANPLIGKHYGKNEWKNGFDPVWRPGAVGWDGFYANRLSGIIASSATDISSSGSYVKPPPYSHFKSTKGTGVRIDPGQISTSNIVFKTKMSFQSLYDHTKEAFYLYSTQQVVDFGFAKMLALEKLLDSRLSSDAAVRVQYEVAQFYSSTAYEKHQPTMPLVVIQ